MQDERDVEVGRNIAYWTLLRDAGVLQFKLIVDGLRDLVLVPASLVAAVMSLINGADGRPGPEFYRLLAAGKRSERWINLFGAVDNTPQQAGADDRHPGEGDIDELVSRLETWVLDEYQGGGVTRQAKERIDRLLDALERRRR